MMKKVKKIMAIFLATVMLIANVNLNAWASETEQKIIIAFEKLNEGDSKYIINMGDKPDLESFLNELPSTLEVYLEDNNDSVELPVHWECVGDYSESKYYYYEFDPFWDEEEYILDENVEIPYMSMFLYDDVSTLSVTSSSNETTIYNFLRNDLGLNVAAACGVMANIYCESSFSPSAHNENDTGGTQSYGICQWNSGEAAGNRYSKLISWCNSNGYTYTSLTGQLQYMKYELESNSYFKYTTLKNNIANTADGAYEASKIWSVYYEGCAQESHESRAKLARDTYWPEYGEKDSNETPEKPYIYDVSTKYFTGDECKINWTESTNATNYWLTVYYNGEVQLQTAVSVNNLSYTLTDLKKGHYDVFLEALNTNGNLGSSCSFDVIDPVKAESPEVQTVYNEYFIGETIELNWKQSDGATNYWITVYCKTAHCGRRKPQIIFDLSVPADCAVSVLTAV